MANSIRPAAAACQVNTGSRDDEPQGNSLSLIRDLLRAAIEESGWKHEALAAAMELPNAAYLSRMLSGEKPIGSTHLLALPDDIETIFARLYAESFGLLVVPQVSDHEDAARKLAAGLIGLLAPQRARMARASLPSSARKIAR